MTPQAMSAPAGVGLGWQQHMPQSAGGYGGQTPGGYMPQPAQPHSAPFSRGYGGAY